MKTQFVNFAILSAAILSLVGCIDESKIQGTDVTYDVQSILENNEMSSVQKSEQLALIGEQLSTPYSFMYADEVLNQSLKLDAGNSRAQLYKRLNAPFMSLKGSIAVLKPVSEKFSSVVKSGFVDFEQIVKRNAAVDSFMRAGQPRRFSSEKQAQLLVDGILQTQNEARLFFKNNKSLTLELHPNLPKADLPTLYARCSVDAKESQGSYHGKYKMNYCPYLQPTRFNIDNGDIEALQHMAAGQQIVSILTTAYDITGGAKYETTLRAGNLSVQQRIAYMKSLKSFGKLRRGNSLAMIKELGTDLFAGAKWAQQWQNRLCPQGWEQEQRPGMLFKKGLCMQDHPDAKPGTTDTAFQVVAAALSGQSVDVFTRGDHVNVTSMAQNPENGNYYTRANLLAAFTNPVSDLKQILPTKIDKCGRTTNLGDSTVAGIFPSRDGEEVAKSIGLIHEECQ